MASKAPEHEVRAALNVQHWQDLTFLHWTVPPAALAPLVPRPLAVDTFDGVAWLGVTPFCMRYLGTPGPRLPLVPRFVEVNVRTYVRGPDGHDGIWFFSLEAPRLAVVAALRQIGLPYQRAATAMRHDDGAIRYASRRRTGEGLFAAEVRAGARLAQHDPLEVFLTGRWNAYSHRWGRLWRVPISHEPWPLHEASARVDVDPLLLADGVPRPDGDVLAHFAPLVHVRIGAPTPAGS